MNKDQLAALVDPQREADALEAEIRKNHMSKPGALKLSERLEQKRLEEAMPDCLFDVQAVYDRITIFQISETPEFETAGGIIKTFNTWEAEKNTAPRGILLTAGLRAMDCLKSNGIELGDTVIFVRMAPWSKKVGRILNEEFRVMVLNVGDIIGSEDLPARLQSGEVRTECKTVERGGVKQQEHFLVDSGGNVWNPHTPRPQEDY